jgi:electron transfer flavoprotein beta subunit
MNIAVCIKQVPETREVEVDPVTGVLKREGVESKMNPFDLYALETALQLKEKHGGKVTVISMGPLQAKAVIREAYMTGADEGGLMSDRRFAGADTLATAYTLAQGLKRLGEFDVIVTGMQTTDGDTAQVGPGIAEFLGIPHVAYVRKVHDSFPDRLIVEQDMADSYEIVEVKCPCLITVTKEVNVPRLPSYRRKLLTENQPINVWCMDDCESFDEASCGLKGSPTQVERVFPPESTTEKTVWTGSSEDISKAIYEKLKDLRFV